MELTAGLPKLNIPKAQTNILMSMLRRTVIVALAVLSAWCAPAWAQSSGIVEVGGVKYEQVANVGNTRLQLNGAGVRYKAIFRVYAAGLYLPTRTGTLEGLLAEPGPRRMHIVMLRDIDANELGKLFTKGMQDNATREDFLKSIPGVEKMGEMFSTRKKLNAGDWFTVDYLPGTGTVISVNGKQQMDAIKEPEFFSSLMHIWLGKSPADSNLKDALLGHPHAGHVDN